VLFTNPPLISLTVITNIYAELQVFFIFAAPAFFIPLGAVIVKAGVLPRVFGYLAILLGVVFALLGVAYLLKLVLPVYVTAFAAVQAVWWLAAAITLMVKAKKVVQGWVN
jgi:hypothetical protein